MIICSFFNDIFSIYDFSIGYWNGFDSGIFWFSFNSSIFRRTFELLSIIYK